MDKNQPLTLDKKNPRVIAAQESEQQLYDYYGLQVKHHSIPLPHTGINIRVTDIGSGDPVVIVPGNTGDAFPLVPLMAKLKGRRIIAINRPGGGLSEGLDHRTVDFRELAVHTLNTVWDAFALNNVPVIAHSIGGHWSLWMALDQPQRVSSLTLLGVPGNLVSTSPPFALRLLSLPIINGLLFDLISPKSIQKALNGLAFMGHSKEGLAQLPDAMSECYFHFQKLPHYKISSLSLMRHINRLTGSNPQITLTAQQLQQVQQPTQFLWGTNDPFASIVTGRQIASLLPNAQFHAIEAGGHLPWLDKPAVCGNLISEFLNSLE
ncbi:MAG: alpha/beta hydrolase [Anaerolineaceae bacterium]|nr:alpha/beta hydrolase [Anaerolineaceae bacterium]